jgi:hypothetical protein
VLYVTWTIPFAVYLTLRACGVPFRAMRAVLRPKRAEEAAAR